MASNIVTHIDGKQYRREFSTGRSKKPIELKYVQQGLKLPPHLKQHVKNWKQLTGKSFSEWAQDQMRNVVYTETV